jgi:acetyl-CoA acetyltransferase
MSARGARDRVAIVGFAHSPVVRHAASALGDLAVETADAAIADAGLARSDIDGFVTSAMFPTAGDHAIEDGISTVTAEWIAARLGATGAHTAGFVGLGQIPGTVALAVEAITSGAATHVLLHRALHNPQGRYHASQARSVAGAQQWTAPQGFFGPVSAIALTYNEYLQRYRATEEAMATVVVEARKNGARLPWSPWHDRPLTVDEYLAAPMISDPIRRLDCDMPVDGVACFVLTATNRARDLPHRPVTVSGCAVSPPVRHRLPLHWPLDDVMDAGRDVVTRLFARSGVGLDDVDLPQLYDGFSPWVYFWLEVLGLCPVGEAHRFVQDGRIDSDRRDGLPVLSGGGALGNGRMHGVPQLLESYLQVAGRAGARQRAGVEVALACASSPHMGGAVVLRSGGS